MRKKYIIFTSITLIFICFLVLLYIKRTPEEEVIKNPVEVLGNIGLSDNVLKHREDVGKFAKEFKVEPYIPILMAIIEVESHGEHHDLMKSSESLGLPPSTLRLEASIEQGCKYFSELLVLAREKECNINTVIQAYNYGPGFIEFVAKQGKSYTYALAEKYAHEKAEGIKVDFIENVAVDINGGWRYQYGNQFYVLAVNQYLIHIAKDL